MEWSLNAPGLCPLGAREKSGFNPTVHRRSESLLNAVEEFPPRRNNFNGFSADT